MAFSALRSFYARAGYSAAPRLPVTRPGYRRPEAGACHRQIIQYPGLQGVHSLIQCGQVQINGQRLSGLRFCRQLCFPGCFLGQLLLFTFHFGGVVTLMMVFRLRTGVSPSVFRFSVSTGRFCSVMLCSASDESSSCGKDTTPVTAPERPAQPDDRRRIPGKIPGPETG